MKKGITKSALNNDNKLLSILLVVMLFMSTIVLSSCDETTLNNADNSHKIATASSEAIESVINDELLGKIEIKADINNKHTNDVDEDNSSTEGSDGDSAVANSNSDSTSGSSGAADTDGSSGNSNATPAPPVSNDITVRVSATCRIIIDNASTLPPELVRAAGTGYLVDTYVTVPKGSSVLDASRAAGGFTANSTGYVTSIYGVAEKAAGNAGPLSGWRYSVNGAYPSTGAANYVLNDGDSVSWGYTLDGGAAY